MPIYNFQCKECSTNYYPVMTFSQFEEYRKADPDSGAFVFCEKCGGVCSYVFDPGNFGASFREGETGGWASKNIKERRLREERRQVLTQKNRDHVKPTPLVPNYNGEVHDRWSEVQDHVRMKEGDAVASTYNSFVSKEVKTS